MYEIGKRFSCHTCGSQVLVLKPSQDGELRCCGTEMERLQPKAAASAD